MPLIKLIYLISLFISICGFSQNNEQREKIQTSNNQRVLEEIRLKKQVEFEQDEVNVRGYLKRYPTLKRTLIKNRKIYYLKKIDEEGNPIYISIKKNKAGRRKCK